MVLMPGWWQSLREALRRETPGETLPRKERLGRVLAAFAESRERVFFVQVGSNDGGPGDHLTRFILERGWSGIMIEPVPYVFDRLVENHAGREGLILENVAVADADEAREFFYLRETDEDLPKWYDRIGSFSLDTVLKHRHRIPDIEDRIVRCEVPCQTLQTLLDQHGVDHVDLIQVDAEGYDFEIIKLIDFKRFKPAVILYEHKHLGDSDKAACALHLENEGYLRSEIGPNTLCVSTEVLLDSRSPITEAWRRWLGPLPAI